MQSFSHEALLKTIEAGLPEGASGKFCVALSGGLDSSVLLHALVGAAAGRTGWSVRALHVDHQLQPQSLQWSAECARMAAGLGVGCITERVTVNDPHGQGIEASARARRYEVFERLLQPGEVLLTAHHADDQLETVLLALLRGSGVPGLAAMPACAVFAQGWHMRPLLAFTRSELDSWAAEHDIRAMHDPSNRDTRFDRNFLRHTVVPAIRQRWPSAALAAGRTARHMAEASGLLEEMAATDLAALAVGDCLPVPALLNLSPARRRNLLRYWLQLRGLSTPSTRKLAALEADMLQSHRDRCPVVSWQGGEVRRHRDLLYAAPSLPAFAAQGDLWWSWCHGLQLPDGSGELSLAPCIGTGIAAARLPDTLRVSYRRGGERLRLPNQMQHRELKKLLQEHDVLPWCRERLPLIHAGDRLVAVADLWITDEFAARAGEDALRVVWSGKPEVYAAGTFR